MWKPSSQMDIENLDNYLAAIERAKEELNNINADIKNALEQKNQIATSSHELIKEKLAEIENKKSDAEALRDAANNIHINNTELANELDRQSKKLVEYQEEISKKNLEFSDLVDIKEKEFELREQEIRKSECENEEKGKLLSAMEKENEEILNKILNDKKTAQEILDQALIEKSNAKTLLDDANRKLKELENSRVELISIQDEVKDKLLSAEKCIEEARLKNADTDEKLQCIIKEKELLNEQIIESRKVKMESIRITEAAQRNIVEANQKIAELKDLRAAMAKQEN